MPMLNAWLGGKQLRGVRLDHKRIHLRPARGKDWLQWARLRERSRSFLIPWEPTWPSDALTRAAFRRRLRQNAHEWAQGSSYSFLLFRSDDDRLLGGITLSNVRRGVAQTGSLGYWIGAEFAHHGYMTEGLFAMMDFAFDQLGLHRLEAACLPNNIPSRGLLLKVGFHEDGYARQYLRINGTWQDHLLFSILKSDRRAATGRRPIREQAGE